MSSYYDDDDDLDIHVRHRAHSPHPVRYVQSPPRPRTYYGVPTGPGYLVPEQHTTVVARARSRERSRSRDYRASSPHVAPVPVPAQPVIINNRIYNEYSSDEDNYSDDADNRRRGRKQVSRRQRRSNKSRSRSHSRSRSRSRTSYMKREDWEAEQARRELDQLRLTQTHDENERRLAKEYRDEAELKRAKRELDEIKNREARAEEEKRIKKELDLKRLKEEEEAAEEKRLRDKEAAEAVERYKQQEAERKTKEKKQKEEYEKEYKRRLQEDLIKSGLDEKAIAAILEKKKVPEALQPVVAASPHVVPPLGIDDRPTYTRMARKHLSIETLRTFRIEYDLDMDPEYVLVKRWVPEWEQDQFWRHTKFIRDKRNKGLLVEEKKHHSRETDFEWVRKKADRRRSKSPGLLMYLAGARPA